MLVQGPLKIDLRGPRGRNALVKGPRFFPLRRATIAKVKPNLKSKWSYQVSGLQKGSLVVQALAVDNVKNKSKLRTVSQALTHS